MSGHGLLSLPFSLYESARLNKEASEATLAAEQIKEKLAWRELSPDQIKALQIALDGNPGAVKFIFPANDPEAAYFTTQIADVFRSKGWGVFTYSISVTGVFFGSFVSVDDNPNRDRICSALNSAGIKFSVVGGIDESKMAGFGSGPSVGFPTENPVRVVIGSKKPSI